MGLENSKKTGPIGPGFVMSFLEMIELFMSVGGQLGTSWSGSGLELREMRGRILLEEVGEYCAAERRGDLVEVLDGLADVAYVAIGSLYAFVGPVVAREILTEVAESNLSKFENGAALKREDGKILKGSGYKEPQIREILEASGILGDGSNG